MARNTKSSRKPPVKRRHKEAETEDLMMSAEEQKARQLIQEVHDAENDREEWQLKQVEWYKQRYGIRKAKSFPWPGASNLHLPLTDSIIRNYLAKMHRMKFGSTPLVTAEPMGAEDLEQARQAELFMDWLLRYRMNDPVSGWTFQRGIVIGDSKKAEQGHVVFKVIWATRVKTSHEVLNLEDDLPDRIQWLILALRKVVAPGVEMPPDVAQEISSRGGPEDAARALLAEEYDFDLEDPKDKTRVDAIVADIKSGKDEISFDYDEVIYDAPQVVPIESKDFLVPGDTTHLQQARVACHRMWMPMQELEEKQRVGLYRNVDKLPNNLQTGGYASDEDVNELNVEKKAREGIETTYGEDNSTMREVWEIHYWDRKNPNSYLERYVMTVDRETNVVLRNVPLPYEHGRLPFIQIRREMHDVRFHSSRGIPEMIKDLQTELNVQINQQTDRETIRLCPWFTYLSGSGFKVSNMRFIPGQGVAVPRHDVINFPVVPDPSPGVHEGRRQEMKAWAEQYSGAIDFGLSSKVNAGGGDARTATEISQISQLSDLLFGMDAMVENDQFSEIFEQIWSLWQQYGPDEWWVRVMNKAAIKQTRRDLIGRFDFRFTGKADSSNPLLRAQKAQFRITQLLPFADRPLKSGDGKTYTISGADLIRDYLEKDDARVASQLMREMPQQEIQQIKDDQMMAQVQEHAGKRGIGISMPKPENLQLQNPGSELGLQGGA